MTINTSLLNSDKVQTLNQLVNLLHLLHHRNKNQHRRSLWWRHFSIFRRQLNALHDETSTLLSNPSTHLERVRLAKEKPALELRVQQRLAFWQDTLVARWYRAFSQLAADGRFAQLGLVLLAVLAEVCNISELTHNLEEMGELEIQNALLSAGTEIWKDLASNEVSIERVGSQGIVEDLGEALSRAAAQSTSEQKSIEAKPTSKIRRAKNTKAKAGNAIDDLFRGL